MLTLLFLILLVSFVGRMIALSIRLTWGITRILMRIVFLPIVLIFAAFSGLIQLGIVVLIIGFIVSLFSHPVQA